MASTRRSGFALRHPVVVDVGCSCRRPKKLSSLFSSFSISHSKPKNTSTSSSSPATTMNTTTTTTTTATNSTWDASFATTNSLYEEEEEEGYNHSPQHPILNEGRRPPTSGASNGGRRRKGRRGRRKGQGHGRVERESVAVAVETEEPYEDFKESMVRMVVENEIYAWDDLNDLLHRFLSLNSPRHHSLILRAFADLWTGLFSPPSPCL